MAITINASNVVLDFGGHTVSGGPSSHGIVVGPVTGVAIVNGRIVGFGGYGLVLDRTINGTVARMSVTQTGNIGIVASGAYNFTISASAVIGPTYGGIILANASSNVTLWMNLVTNARGYGGIAVANSTGNIIAANRATGNFAVTETGELPLDLSDSSPTCAGNAWLFNDDSAATIQECTD